MHLPFFFKQYVWCLFSNVVCNSFISFINLSAGVIMLPVVKIVLKNCVWIFLILCLFLHSYDAHSSDFEPGGKPQIKIINPAADAVIGAVVNVRDRGPGLFGCGETKLSGIATVDALSWIVQELNQKIWSGFSPNVSIGLHLMDSCSRTRTAASQLADFLPELKGEEDLSKDGLPFKFGIIDAVGLDKEADVSKALEDLNVPVVRTDIRTDSVEDVVKTVFSFLGELRWEHLAVVHSNSLVSLSALKTFTKFLKKSEVCVPWIVNVENMVFEEDNKEWENILKSNIPIVSLLPSEEHNLILKNLKIVQKSKKKIPILFTDLILRENLELVPVNEIELFATIPFPEKEIKFENYYSKNSIITGVRTEDELELIQRTKIVRKIKNLVQKMSYTLGDAIRNVCPAEKNLCSDLFGSEGRSSFAELLSKTDWTVNGLSYGLIKYQYQFPDGHVHLRKVMVLNSHNNLDVFESDLPADDVNCDSDEEEKPECRCLEIKNGRSGSARNIGDQGKRQNLLKQEGESEFVYYSPPEIKPVEQSPTNPTVYSSLRDPVNALLAGLTLLGALFTLFIGQYFATFAALPNGGTTTGTSVLGYFILIALFLLYSTNLSFILTPSASSCAVRRFGPGLGYAMAFSAMMIKVWVSWRQTRSDKSEKWKPSTLVSLSMLFTAVEALLSGTWLMLVPPVIHYNQDRWICYPSADLDSHLLVSMIYVVGLLFATAILAIRTCSQVNNSEARWILISSALVAIVFSCWGISVATSVWQLQRTASTNLAAATIILLCLYIPKIKLLTKLKKSQKEGPQYPVDLDKEYPVFAGGRPPYPLMLDYNVVSPAVSEDPTDSGYSNQAYSIDGGTESMSIPFEIDTSSYSDPEPEPLTFSTFFDDPQITLGVQTEVVNDPTQVVPSNLYPLDMFSNEQEDNIEHCRPGTNEFTPSHRTSSQMYLNPPPEWVP